MNEPHIPAELNALDELASAIVDGEAVLPADADQALVERVAAMRTACSAIAVPVDPPTASVREAGIAAALGASVTSTDVHSLATRRRRARAVPAAAVAAAIALLVGIGIMGSGDDAGETDVAGVATTAPTAKMQASDPAESTPPSISTAATTATMDASEKSVPSTVEAPVQALAPATNDAPATTVDLSAIVTADAAGIDGSEVGEASLHEVEPLEEVGGTESRLAAGSADDDAQASTDSAYSAYSEFDTFTFLFPDAEELASTIRAGEAIPAGPVPASGWPPDCGIDEAEILDGEEVLGTTSLFFQGDLPVFGLLYVGSTSWTLVEAHTCETFTWPPAHD
ncbi:MAG: hypothetical protein VX516_04060 [Actinomycetota bacterium]|nr:hypothetical protein [Actinomycetota bacterium]MEE3275068.1 hypothetical protein [Actinomycetota bacterium]